MNYGRETINVYLRSIRRLSQLMVSHGLALDQLTPEIAAELLLRTEWHGDRRQYAVFAVRRFVTYLVTQGVVKSPGAALAGLGGTHPALAQKQGGILKVYHRDSPASMSILERSEHEQAVA